MNSGQIGTPHEFGVHKKRISPAGVRVAYFLHKRLVKPGEPILHHCDNCGRPLFEANSDTIEIHNSFGLPYDSLKSSDSWVRIKCHSCKAEISILWR